MSPPQRQVEILELFADAALLAQPPKQHVPCGIAAELVGVVRKRRLAAERARQSVRLLHEAKQTRTPWAPGVVGRALEHACVCGLQLATAQGLQAHKRYCKGAEHSRKGEV